MLLFFMNAIAFALASILETSLTSTILYPLEVEVMSPRAIHSRLKQVSPGNFERLEAHEDFSISLDALAIPRCHHLWSDISVSSNDSSK